MRSWKLASAATAALAAGLLLALPLWLEAPDPQTASRPAASPSPLPLQVAPAGSGAHAAPAASPSPAVAPPSVSRSPEPAAPRWSETGPIAKPAGSGSQAPGEPEPGTVGADDTELAASVQTVTVLGADKKPVSDALVSLRSGKGPLLKRRRTGSNGTFTITAAECRGSNASDRRVWIRHARWGRQGPFSLSSRDATVTITLASTNTGKVSGRIVSTKGEVPAVPVIIVKMTLLTTRFATADFTRWDPATGNYEIELVPSDRFTGKGGGHFTYTAAYELRVRAVGYCDSETVRIFHMGAKEVDNFTLEPECVVNGTLTVPVGFEQDPAAEDPKTASFEIEDTLPAGARTEARSVRLGERHRFELRGVHPGWHRIRASVGGMVGAWGTLQLQDGESVDSFTLHLDPAGWNVPTVEVTGKVLDKEGTPIPECVIITDGGRAETLEDGSFVFRLTPGVHDLMPAADGFAPPPTPLTIAVKRDTPMKPLEIVLESLDGQSDE